jgi:hypothetical protein
MALMLVKERLKMDYGVYEFLVSHMRNDGYREIADGVSQG